MGKIEKIIRNRMIKEFDPLVIEVTDMSYLHRGHEGARPEGETHFKVFLVSKQFKDKSRLERHQWVHHVLKEEIKSIHALELVLKAPEEHQV